ncbi:hypothetical protein C1H76_5667 [Elsinoe australis]|uniref:Uncharacterized protein n=1 Tax=Elsinoe australis TaxID=40998 RepID=A0A4U7B1T8_9PEZI|nr:hypothetical protein C1H76_5667 [Elsinoe australis]
MVHKVLFWGGFGIAVRLWQLGIQMRPFFNKEALWAFPAYGGVGAAFGYWLKGVDDNQNRILAEQRERLIERRRRRAELAGTEGAAA